MPRQVKSSWSMAPLSAIGRTATQLATAAGIRVVGTASPRNHGLVRACGADQVFDYKSSTLVDDVVNAVGKDQFVGIYDAISAPETYALEKGKLKCLIEPLVVGTGLERVQAALDSARAGVGAQNVVVEP